MVNHSIITLYYVIWNLLVFSSVCFLISGLDDFFFDAYYWISSTWRAIKLRHRKRLSYAKLNSLPEKLIAVMIPCWHEAGIIEAMLHYNVNAIDYEKYDLFVGVYPNDPDTIQSVSSMAQMSSHVHCVIGPQPGPTNKASNLNAIYSHIMNYEKEHQIEYSIFILHDSEDIIHPLSFKYFNYLIPPNDMVQIPIYPLAVSMKNFTHWTYNAEFCESHTKDIIVRERIGGLVPSAGVGTAFSRAALDALKMDRHGAPFAVNSLTEDYSTALQLRLRNLKQIFVTQYIYKKFWCKKWYFFGPPVLRKMKEYIATRAVFPLTYMTAVRQKTRWVLGIVFQEWINTGWKGNLATLYTLLHDRKSIFTHLISGMFFLLIPFWTFYMIYTANSPDYPSLQDQLDKNPFVWYCICISSFLMLGRWLQRSIAVWRIYGLGPALITGPLILYGNVINMHALLRAYWQFFFSPKTKKSVKWDKTDHTFPAQHLLAPYRLKIGDILLESHFIDKKKLAHALNLQAQTGDQLGNVLQKLGYISPQQFTAAIAKQFGLDTISPEHLIPLPYNMIPHLSKHHYDQLIAHQTIPIRLSANELLIAIHDPSNEVQLAKIMDIIQPYQAKFILITS